MNLRGRIYSQYAIFLVELKKFEYCCFTWKLILYRYDLALAFFKKAMKTFQLELLQRQKFRFFMFKRNNKKYDRRFEHCVYYLITALHNMSTIEGELLIQPINALNTAKLGKWYATNYCTEMVDVKL